MCICWEIRHKCTLKDRRRMISFTCSRNMVARNQHRQYFCISMEFTESIRIVSWCRYMWILTGIISIGLWLGWNLIQLDMEYICYRPIRVDRWGSLHMLFCLGQNTRFICSFRISLSKCSNILVSNRPRKIILYYMVGLKDRRIVCQKHQMLH